VCIVSQRGDCVVFFPLQSLRCSFLLFPAAICITMLRSVFFPFEDYCADCSPWFGSKLQSKERLIKLQEVDQKAYKEVVKDITQHDHDGERVYFSSYREQLGFGEFDSHFSDLLNQSYLCCPI